MNLNPPKGQKAKKEGKKGPEKQFLSYDLTTPPVLQKEAFLAQKTQFMIYLFWPQKWQVDHKMPFLEV